MMLRFRLIEEAGIPCFLFVNRIDAAAGRVSEIISALQVYCRHGIAVRQVPIREDGQIVGAVDLISERAWEYQEGQPSALIEIPDSVMGREQEARTELLEALADYDDALLEQLIEDRQPLTEKVYDIATTVLQHHDLVPVRFLMLAVSIVGLLLAAAFYARMELATHSRKSEKPPPPPISQD